jgi:hypothetical protein
MGRALLAIAGFALGACSGDPVYVLGRLPGSGGSGGSAGAAPDGGSGAGGSSGSGGAAGDAPEGDGNCVLPVPIRDYAFDGTGSAVTDRRGGAPGEIRGGAALDGSGELTLDGEDDYVDLPNGILAGLDEVTVAVWVRHLGGPAYTRIFDFGVGTDGEDPEQGLGTVGRSYLAATPGTGFVPDELAALISNEGSAGEIVAPTERELDDTLHLVAVSASPLTLQLFLDGALIGSVRSSVPLSSIEDANNWLARSQYDADPHLQASYAGAQVYGRALSECAIRTLFAAGP